VSGAMAGAAAPSADEVERAHGLGAIAPRPLTLVRGEGAALFDAEGRRYIDATSSYGVACLGHGHAGLARAVADQAARLTALTVGYGSDVRAAYVTELLDALGSPFERVFLCNSGTEAIEAALKVARHLSGRTGFVACARAFHGRTFGALGATAEPRYREPFAPLVPGFAHVPFGDADAMRAAVGPDTAAVVLEPIQGEGGVRPAPPGYLAEVRRICDGAGALLILDEVQTGFGRTGDLFAFQGEGVTPDIVALAKGIAGGVPMGAIALRAGLGPMPLGSHGSTFGGSPLACAAALFTLRTLREEALPARAARLGEHALGRLRAESGRRVREVRGRGLMIGVELRTPAAPVLDALVERGVLAIGAGRTVVRLLPPLVIDEQDWDEVLDAVIEVTR